MDAAGANDATTRLRGAVHGGDGQTIVALLAASSPDQALQLAGDGLTVALGQHTPGAPALAAGCADALRERGWPGDDDLADQLDGHRGAGPTPILRPVPINLEELSDVLEGDPRCGGGRIDLDTGQVWPDEAVEAVRELGEDDPAEDDDPDRWLVVECRGSRDGYRDMETFIATLTDPEAADRLRIAISGPGAFRRFKEVLDRWPDQIRPWRTFADERRRGRARAWLAAAGYTVAHPAPPRP